MCLPFCSPWRIHYEHSVRMFVRLADYCGKIRSIMLHKPEILGSSTCFASTTCNVNSTLPFDPGCRSPIRSHFSTPDVLVKHSMAVKSVSLKHIVAVLECFSCEMPKKYSTRGVNSCLHTHCHDML